MKNGVIKKRIRIKNVSMGASFFMLILSVVVIILVTFSFVYYKNVETDLILMKRNEYQIIQKQQSLILKTLQNVVGDLMVAASHHEIRHMFENDGKGYLNTSAEFSELMKYKKKYDQVRYIDENGDEKVRVNYISGNTIVVPRNELQNKAGRYYFKDTIALKRGEVFMSPLDLNIENGQVEIPYKPMIRFATPVFDKQNHKRGIIIINYLGQVMIDDLIHLSATTYGSILMINQNGDWIKGPTRESDWSFMFPDKNLMTFGEEHRHAWEDISKNDRGQVIINDSIFTYDTVYPLEIGVKATKGSSTADGDSKGFVNEHDFSWKLVSYIPNSVVSKMRMDNLLKLSPFLILTLAIVVLGCYFLARSIVKRRLVSEELLKANIELEERVRARTEELSKLNKGLEKKVKIETEKRLYNEKLLNQQTRFIEIGQMFTAIAHHWRQPLNVIGLRIQDVADAYEEGSMDTAYIDDLIDFCMAQIKGLSYSIDNFRTYFSTTDDPVEYEMMNVVRDTVKLLEGQFKTNGIGLSFHGDCGDSSCSAKSSEEMVCVTGGTKMYGHPQFMKQVLMNLLINSYDAILAHRAKKPNSYSKISLRSEVIGNNIKITVSDTGGGVPDDVIEKIFDPYFTTKDEGKGTGMGLYMSKVIVEKNMQGKLHVTNSIDGAEFTIIAPLKYDHDETYNSSE